MGSSLLDKVRTSGDTSTPRTPPSTPSAGSASASPFVPDSKREEPAAPEPSQKSGGSPESTTSRFSRGFKGMLSRGKAAKVSWTRDLAHLFIATLSFSKSLDVVSLG